MRAGLIPEDRRVQLIDGELVEYEAQGAAHGTSVGLAQDLFTCLFGSGHVVWVQSPIALTEYSTPEPDVVVTRGTRRGYLEAHPQVSDVVVLLEIADSTLPYDLGEKASLYASSGLLELWVLNLVDRQLEVLRDPVPEVAARHQWQYQTHLTVSRDGTAAPLAAPHIEARVADLLP